MCILVMQLTLLVNDEYIHTSTYVAQVWYTYDTYCNVQSWINLKEDESIKVIIIRLIFCYYDDTFSLNLGQTPKNGLWCLSYLDKKIKSCFVCWVNTFDSVEKYSSKLPSHFLMFCDLWWSISVMTVVDFRSSESFFEAKFQ